MVGSDLDGSKKLAYAILKVKGIGLNFAKYLVRDVGLNPDARIGYLSDDDIQKLESTINSPEKLKFPSYILNRSKDLESGKDLHLFGSDLMFRKKMDIDTMRALKTWKGTRHSLGLKVRGQKTRTSGRKGKAMGVKKSLLIAKKRAENKT